MLKVVEEATANIGRGKAHSAGDLGARVCICVWSGGGMEGWL